MLYSSTLRRLERSLSAHPAYIRHKILAYTDDLVLVRTQYRQTRDFSGGRWTELYDQNDMSSHVEPVYCEEAEYLNHIEALIELAEYAGYDVDHHDVRVY